MSKNEWKKWVAITGRMLLAYALVFAQGAWAGQNQATKDKAASPQKAVAQQANDKQSALPTTPIASSKQTQGEESESAVGEEKPSNDASHQGIKVHGHWTIEVRNSDGTLVTHREFENSIQSSGTAALSSLLGGNQLLGPWQVDLVGNPQPCVENAGQTPLGFSAGPEPCVIVPSNTVLNGIQSKTQVGGISFNLTVTATSGQLVLTGSTTAATTTSVSSVATVLSPCINTGTVTLNSGGQSTFPCLALQFPIPAPFTSADLTVSPAQPVPVGAGQTIAVTVTISFS